MTWVRYRYNYFKYPYFVSFNSLTDAQNFVEELKPKQHVQNAIVMKNEPTNKAIRAKRN